MVLLSIFETTLPLTNPVLKFLGILIIILSAPLILNRLKIPALLGLIIAGAIVGPNGINLLERDSGILLSGTAGLLYIMFLAGLEMDLADLKKNGKRSVVFGLLTFLIPMILGYFAGFYVLHFSVLTSVLLASMFASHTLLVYPILSRFGVARNPAVNVAIGGTVITDTLALLILAIIVALQSGEVGTAFWLRMLFSLVIFVVLVLFFFPRVGKVFLKRIDDPVSQYLFVLTMVFLGAVLAELAGIEAIIGAFLTGLALNRIVPHGSPLMNRVEFIGNAIFIPFFLLSVGMLVDFRAFVKDAETIKVSVVMVVVATLAKFLAAFFTQKIYRFSPDQRRLIFGLSNAQAAATLAAVLVGYNIILGVTDTGEPIRLLNDAVLNGTIVMILVTCTIASFAAQRGAKNLALSEELNPSESAKEERDERILFNIRNRKSLQQTIELIAAISSKKGQREMSAVQIVDLSSDHENAEREAQKLLEQTRDLGAGSGFPIKTFLRFDVNYLNAINSLIKEEKITDFYWVSEDQAGIEDILGRSFNEHLLKSNDASICFIHDPKSDNKINRLLVAVPQYAEREFGFPFWLVKIWKLASKNRAEVLFLCHPDTKSYLNELPSPVQFPCSFETLASWDDLLIITKDIRDSDMLIFVMSRKGSISYDEGMSNIAKQISNYFSKYRILVLYPRQSHLSIQRSMDLNDAAYTEPIEKLDELRKRIKRLFRI